MRIVYTIHIVAWPRVLIFLLEHEALEMKASPSCCISSHGAKRLDVAIAIAIAIVLRVPLQYRTSSWL